MSDPEFKHIGHPAIKLFEEIGELIQAICKGERFGWDNHQPGRRGINNLQELRSEWSDLQEAYSNFINRIIANGKESKMSEFKKYVRKGFSEMRSYVPNEDLSSVSVSDADTPELGGMIARNPKDHTDQWYVAKKYFEDNLEPA